MVLEDVEIIPREIPEHTYWLLRCVEYEFAKAFIEKGSMRFRHPSEWCNPDGTSRWDRLEGAYASQRGFDPTLDGLLKAFRKDVCTETVGDFTFYKSNEVLSLRAHCLYGLNSNNMHMQKVRSQDHKFHQSGVIKKEFFQELFPRVKEEDMDTLSPKEKPVVLLIRPDKFVDFVKTKLMEKGVRKEEIIIMPVSYMDYYRKPFVIGCEPEELFSKHIDYSDQCEIRIVIDTRREEVASLFNEIGVIELGRVDESIATLSEYYFKDMYVEIRGNKLYYELPKEEQHKFDELGDDFFISIIFQVLSDEMPDSPMTIEAIEQLIKDMLGVLRRRDPEVAYDWDTNILTFKGENIDVGSKTGFKILEHYINYIFDGEYEKAGDQMAKHKRFFRSRYVGGQYFKAYLDWCEREKHNPCGKTTRGCTLKGCHDMAAQNKKIIQK